MKHHTDWKVEHLGTDTGGGTLRWTSPTGATYVTKPTPHTPATLTKDISTDDRDRHKERDDDDTPLF